MTEGNDTVMRRTCTLMIVAGLLAACSPPPLATNSVPPTAPPEATGAPVARRAIPEPAMAPAPVAATSAIVVPPGALYVCVSETGGARQTTAIEFSPKVGALCAKDPEMSPCQYERNVCRKRGGRVYAANGAEITMATEAEYDRKVMRIILKSN
jgi:hypothetical protein